MKYPLVQIIKEGQNLKKIYSKNRLTEEDAERIGHKLKEEIRKRFTETTNDDNQISKKP